MVGFDYELMQAFAKQHELQLQLVVRDSPEAAIEALKAGADVIAASLTDTPERRTRPDLQRSLFGNHRTTGQP
ncbi:MAG: transporter substrate-binding domain-containing protein [Thiolinea sp.]